MSYIYGNIEDAKVGDVVEALISVNNITKGKLYVIRQSSTNGSVGHYINDEGDASSGINLDSAYWKLVKTKPGNTAKDGDKVICIAEDFDLQVSDVKTITEVDKENSMYSIKLAAYWHRNIDFLVLCTEESSIKPTQKRNLAFYKESEEHWTEEEYINICTYVGEAGTSIVPEIPPYHKYIYDNKDNTDFMYSWEEQEKDHNFSSCTKVSYESIFNIAESNQTKTQIKGNNMNTHNENIIITMTATEYAKHNKSNKCKTPKSDLQLEIKYPYTAKIFSEDGTYKSKLNAKTLTKLNKSIAKHLSHNQFDTVKTLKVIATTTTKAPALVKSEVK